MHCILTRDEQIDDRSKLGRRKVEGVIMIFSKRYGYRLSFFFFSLSIISQSSLAANVSRPPAPGSQMSTVPNLNQNFQTKALAKCATPPPKNPGCIKFVANKQDNSGIGIADTKNFVYLEGFGGPTGDGKDWWGNMEPDEKERTRIRAAKCGFSLPDDESKWFSKAGIDCILNGLADSKLAGVQGAFEIDNMNWFFEGKKRGTDFKSQAEIYKYIEQRTQGSCFRIVAKNLTKPSEFNGNGNDLKEFKKLAGASDVTIQEEGSSCAGGGGSTGGGGGNQAKQGGTTAPSAPSQGGSSGGNSAGGGGSGTHYVSTNTCAYSLDCNGATSGAATGGQGATVGGGQQRAAAPTGRAVAADSPTGRLKPASDVPAYSPNRSLTARVPEAKYRQEAPKSYRRVR